MLIAARKVIIVKLKMVKIAATAAIALATASVTVPASPAHAWTPPNYTNKCNQTYCFKNYDLYPQSTGNCYNDASLADNPINLVFYDNATASNVSSILQRSGYTSTNNSTDCEWFNYANGTLWFSTKGFKTPANCGTDYHIRPYGSNYSPDWGYFMVAETHEDRFDIVGCSSAASYGYQEYAEHYAMNAVYGASCYDNGFQSPCVYGTSTDAWGGFNNQLGSAYGPPAAPCDSTAIDGLYEVVAYSGHCFVSDGNASIVDVH
jgi:hypothetical protein